jgi:hypothetical protein
MCRVVRRRNDYIMRVLGLGLAFLAVLTICACDTEEVIIPVPPTPTPQVVLPTPTPTAEPEPTSQPLEFPMPAPARVSVRRVDDRTCVDCHTSQQALRVAMEGVLERSKVGTGNGQWAAGTVQVEAWERVWLDQALFFETLHGRYGCVTCHGGIADTTLPEVAHQGLRAEPSTAGVCADCHAQEVAGYRASLHANLTGYRTVLAARSSPNQMARLEEMMSNHCDDCHTTTCGQCHITRAESAGGGLLDGHLFQKRTPVDETCAGCHGSRIYTEYKGNGAELTADVHWSQGEMSCYSCHLPEQMHGPLGEFGHRYDDPPTPSCQEPGCHPDVGDDAVEQHDEIHLQVLSCHACHSTAYRNCYGCHVSVEDGIPTFEVGQPRTLFKIGRNPLANPDRPWLYVPVRHVPIERDSFAYYGPGLLNNFDALPVWKYATPHNIQRITPQNASCNACHGNTSLFLTVDDLPQEEWKSNLDVVVETIPRPVAQTP